jgi:uncharacterized coiled-coil protein SlyX
VGFEALYSNTTDGFNTAIGSQALYSNTGTGGHFNVATGYQALYSNITGRRNVANGSTAIGFAALESNVGGVGVQGSYNTAIGNFALDVNTTGDSNTAVGSGALLNNTSGSVSTAVGNSALLNTTNSYNIGIGFCAGQNLTTGINNIDIAAAGVAGESNTIRIGNAGAFTDVYGNVHPVHTATYIAGIMGKTSPKGTPVFINANGQLGTATSSARFKDAIKPMDKASEAIHALKPVTFRYKKEIDPDGTPQFGLVAEDVANVNPDLVVRDGEGKVYTVRYEAVNAMLLNEFLKEHRTVQELKSTVAKQEAIIAQQQKGIEAVTARLEEQASQIQKVSAQLELNKPAPQMVGNNQ